MEDPDVDFRYMALNDLTNTILDDSTIFGADEALEAKTVNKVIQLVQDKNSEVKNQAVKWQVPSHSWSDICLNSHRSPA